MASDEWRWADPKGQQRLLRTDDLRKALSGGTLPPNVRVWRRGWRAWKPASEVPELMESALAPENGSPGKLTPPPSFVVAAQSELESVAEQDGPEEPPPPPKYVAAPIVVKSKPPEAPKLAASAKPPVVSPMASPSAKPPPVPTSAKPPPVKPHVRPSATPPPLPPKKESIRPEAIDAAWGDEVTQKSEPPIMTMPTVIGVPALPTNVDLPPRATLPVSPAPPPMAAPREAHWEAPKSSPPPPMAQRGIQKHATLIGLEQNPMFPAPSPPPPSASPPIVAPSPSANPPGTLHAVTQPPPWEGSAEIQMPKIPPSGVPKVQQPVEELSGSILLDDSQAGPPPRQREVELSSSDLMERESSVSVVKPLPLGVGAKASTLLGLAPSPLPMRVDAPRRTPSPPVVSAPPEEKRELAPSPGIRSFDLRALRGDVEKQIRELIEGPRPRLYLFGGVAAFVVFMFFLMLRLLFGGSRDEVSTRPSATASASAPPTPKTALPVASTASPVVAPPKLSACSVSGDAHVVSPHALIAAGVEVVALGDSIALGFASGPKEAMVVVLDPASIAASSTNRVNAQNPVRRVTPSTSVDKAAIDADVKTDKIKGRRTVGNRDIGGVNGELAWAAHGTSDTSKLWALEADAAVEAVRGAPMSDGIVVTYRHNGAIWVGAAKGDKLDSVLTGSPVRTPGLGAQVGSPTLAVSEGNVLVAWADRAAASEPWGIRLVSWHPGDAAKAAQSFKLPSGGLGEHAMAPGLSALSGGKFLLVWTEGPVSSHQVRAQVLNPDGTPSGNAMTVSAEGVNAGQGQAAVLSDGRGVVAFLAGSGKAFEVRATPIRCQ